MAGQVAFVQPPAPSEDFEIVYDDFKVASQAQCSPLIDPSTIKLRHRLGRGPFGDVWLATLHQTAEDYEEYHEVAVKMLHHVKEDNIKTVLDKLAELFSKSQELKGVCQMYGTSIISGKVRQVPLSDFSVTMVQLFVLLTKVSISSLDMYCYEIL